MRTKSPTKRIQSSSSLRSFSPQPPSMTTSSTEKMGSDLFVELPVMQPPSTAIEDGVGAVEADLEAGEKELSMENKVNLPKGEEVPTINFILLDLVSSPPGSGGVKELSCSGKDLQDKNKVVLEKDGDKIVTTEINASASLGSDGLPPKEGEIPTINFILDDSTPPSLTTRSGVVKTSSPASSSSGQVERKKVAEYIEEKMVDKNVSAKKNLNTSDELCLVDDVKVSSEKLEDNDSSLPGSSKDALHSEPLRRIRSPTRTPPLDSIDRPSVAATLTKIAGIASATASTTSVAIAISTTAASSSTLTTESTGEGTTAKATTTTTAAETAAEKAGTAAEKIAAAETTAAETAKKTTPLSNSLSTPSLSSSLSTNIAPPIKTIFLGALESGQSKLLPLTGTASPTTSSEEEENLKEQKSEEIQKEAIRLLDQKQSKVNSLTNNNEESVSSQWFNTTGNLPSHPIPTATIVEDLENLKGDNTSLPLSRQGSKEIQMEVESKVGVENGTGDDVTASTQPTPPLSLDSEKRTKGKRKPRKKKQAENTDASEDGFSAIGGTSLAGVKLNGVVGRASLTTSNSNGMEETEEGEVSLFVVDSKPTAVPKDVAFAAEIDVPEVALQEELMDTNSRENGSHNALDKSFANSTIGDNEGTGYRKGVRSGDRELDDDEGMSSQVSSSEARPSTSTSRYHSSELSDNDALLQKEDWEVETDEDGKGSGQAAVSASVRSRIISDDQSPLITGRYYKEPDFTRICALCGEAGHSSRDCTHSQCFICGVVDGDHEARTCPVTLVCSNCGSRGHRSRECRVAPPPGISRNYGANRNERCEQCGSLQHMSVNCPTWWRVYVTEGAKRRKGSSSGTNGFKVVLACGNCGSGKDHFVDNCLLPRGHPMKYADSSAFNFTALGPFAPPAAGSNSSSHSQGSARNHDRFSHSYPHEYGPSFEGGATGSASSARRRGAAPPPPPAHASPALLDRFGMRRKDVVVDNDDNNDDDDWFASRKGSAQRSGGSSGALPQVPPLQDRLWGTPNTHIHFSQSTQQRFGASGGGSSSSRDSVGSGRKRGRIDFDDSDDWGIETGRYQQGGGRSSGRDTPVRATPPSTPSSYSPYKRGRDHRGGQSGRERRGDHHSLPKKPASSGPKYKGAYH